MKDSTLHDSDSGHAMPTINEKPNIMNVILKGEEMMMARYVKVGWKVGEKEKKNEVDGCRLKIA